MHVYPIYLYRIYMHLVYRIYINLREYQYTCIHTNFNVFI